MHYRRTAPGIYRAHNDQGEELCTVAKVHPDNLRGADKWFAYGLAGDVYGPTREAAVNAYITMAKDAAELKEAKDAVNALCDKVEATMYAPPGGSFSSAWHCLVSGQENADYTVAEGNVEDGSADYYRLIISGFETNMGELDPSYGDPYTRNIEADQQNKEGAFAPTEYELLSQQVRNGADTEARMRLEYAEGVAEDAGLDGAAYDAIVIAVYNRGDKYLSGKVFVNEATDGGLRTLVQLRARGDKVVQYVTEYCGVEAITVSALRLDRCEPEQLFIRRLNEHVRRYHALNTWVHEQAEFLVDFYDAQAFAEYHMTLQYATPAYCQAVVGDFNRRVRCVRYTATHPKSGRLITLWARRMNRHSWLATDDDGMHTVSNWSPASAVADYKAKHLGATG